MASNLQKRLDKLERGIHALLEKKETKPLFVSESESAREGATVIVMPKRCIGFMMSSFHVRLFADFKPPRRFLHE